MRMSSNLLHLAQDFISQVMQNGADQNMVNAPWKKDALNAIMSGDQARGKELADNIMQSYGFSSPEEAVQRGIQNLSGKR